jgi:ribonucleoside-diphosphate reductase alpha chain
VTAQKAESRNFETLYFAAVTASMELAKLEGLTQHLKGLNQGEFQHNLWNIKDEDLSGRWDWAALRKEVMEHEFVIHY